MVRSEQCPVVAQSVAPSREALAAPGTPSNLTASANGSTVTLTWGTGGSGDPAASYIVDAGSSSGASNIVSFDTGSAATSMTATAVPNGTYFVRVRARNSAGVSGASNEAMLVVGTVASSCDLPPDSPTDATSSLNGSLLTLSWRAPSGGCPPESYVIEAGSSADASDIADFDTGNASTTFSADLGNAITGSGTFLSASAPASGTFYVRIKGKNKGRKGPASKPTNFTRGPAPAPAPPKPVPPPVPTPPAPAPPVPVPGVSPCTDCYGKFSAESARCEKDYPMNDFGSRPGYTECNTASNTAFKACLVNGRWPGCKD